MARNNFIWNKESEYSIYDAIDDWGYHTFACLMEDNTLQKFTGMWDENINGEHNLYIECENYTYTPNDIIMWIEIPGIKTK